MPAERVVFRGITLAHNVRQPADIDRLLAAAEAAGAECQAGAGGVLRRAHWVLRRPRRSSLGSRVEPALCDRGRRRASCRSARLEDWDRRRRRGSRLLGAGVRPIQEAAAQFARERDCVAGRPKISTKKSVKNLRPTRHTRQFCDKKRGNRLHVYAGLCNSVHW